MDSLVEKEVLEDASAYVNELDANSEYKVTTTRKKLVEQHHQWKKAAYKDMPGNTQSERVDEDGKAIRPKFLSNHTHYSSTDPEAKISVKPGKARQLNYAAQLSVDDAHHVITGACASTAGSKDSAILPDIVEQTLANLADNDLQLEQLIADAGYSSGQSLQYLEEKDIDAWIPNFGQYKPERPGFVYNQEKDQYECVQEGGNGAILPMKKQHADSKGYEKKTYRSSETVCKHCPLRASCLGGNTKFKKIDDSLHKPYYDRMHQKLTTHKAYHRRLVKRRSATVEPVLGTLINHMSLRRVNTRGLKGAHKHTLMAALCYNLKKYLKFCRKRVQTKAQALTKPIGEALLNPITPCFLTLGSKNSRVHFYPNFCPTKNSPLF
jgi:hypothetical protein